MLKKILIFSTAYHPFIGGAEVAIKEITDRISNVQFDLITPKFKKNLPDFEIIGNVNVYRFGVGVSLLDKIFLPFWGTLLALRLNKINHYDVFWCMMVSFASGAAYIANVFSRKKVPIVLTLQEGDSEKYLKTKWFGLINLSWKMALKRASAVTVISTYLAERAKRFGYKKEVKLIPNGVDVEKFELRGMNYELKEKIRKELGLKEGDIGLITTSRLNIKNGVGDVIVALKFLPENVKFIILGTGELEEKLKLLTHNFNLETRVLFKGFVSHQDMPKYLKACDIFIRPSLSEGQGVSFIEAMAAKLPVIATPVGGISDFLFEGETGYFCQPGNPESIVNAVKKVMSDPNKNQITENAYKMVLEKYNWNKITNNMMQVLSSCN